MPALEIDTSSIIQQNFVGECFFNKNEEQNPSLSQILEGLKQESIVQQRICTQENLITDQVQ